MKNSGVTIGGVCFCLMALVFPGTVLCVESNPPPFKISVSDAVLMALEHNPAFRVQRLQPRIVRTREDTARSAFDPILFGELSRNRQNSPEVTFQSDTNSTAETTLDRTAFSAGISETLPTGTRMELSGRTVQDLPEYNRTVSRMGLAVNQPLMAGAGRDVNLAVLRQARLDTQISVFELRGFTQALVAEVQQAYWEYVQKRDQREVFRDSLKVAERQWDETRQRIQVGKLPELEAVAAEAEIASRHEGLIIAETQYEVARLKLLRLLNVPDASLWTLMPDVTEVPVPPEKPLENVQAHVAAALAGRPDLNQARLVIRSGEIEVVRTRNGLLPKMDVFVTLGRSGYASSFEDSAEGRDATGYDVGVGLQVAWPLKNRAARADHKRAVAGRYQAEEAYSNLCQLAQEDVRVAWVKAEGALALEKAAQITQKLQERKLEAERSKFNEGKSTSLLVAQVERDLLISKLATIQAVIATLTTRIDLYQKEGSLLSRLGLTIPEN